MKTGPARTPQAPGLTGKCVLITRPRHQCQKLAELLESRGARVQIQPTIEILPVLAETSNDATGPSLEQLDDEIERLISRSAYSRVVFASTNGVNFFFDRLMGSHDADTRFRDAPSIDWVAMGRGTAGQLKLRLKALAKLSQQPCPEIAIPPKANSASLADFLIHQSTESSTLIVRANRGSHVLPSRLSESNLAFSEVVAYQSVDVTTLDPEIQQALDRNEVDWITMTSSAIAKAAGRLFQPWLDGTSTICLASISPTTSEAMRTVGMEPDAEAERFDLDGLVAAMEAYHA